ncbi:hypothetical protein [Mesorhizobium tianshanense]|uniref:hypothetical protein n=1 Tax=Mesorhizobium tianshanense TaxID=39844 RepID=UPI0024E07757|nr:hypothetical protein [Mesorhizobium tianshanense]
MTFRQYRTADEIVVEPLRFLLKRGETGGVDVFAQEVAVREKSRRAEIGTGQIPRQGGNGFAIGGNRIEEQPFLLVSVVEFVGLRGGLAHLPHLPSEAPDGLKESVVFEVAKDFVAIADSVDIMQGRVKERLQIVLVASHRDGRDDLIEVQVHETGGCFYNFLRCSTKYAFEGLWTEVRTQGLRLGVLYPAPARL